MNKKEERKKETDAVCIWSLWCQCVFITAQKGLRCFSDTEKEEYFFVRKINRPYFIHWAAECWALSLICPMIAAPLIERWVLTVVQDSLVFLCVIFSDTRDSFFLFYVLFFSPFVLFSVHMVYSSRLMHSVNKWMNKTGFLGN